MKTSLRRYTELPFLIDLLQTRKITLLNPATWDDKNDAYYINRYAEAQGFQSTYALCLAESQETYHHWKVFSHGTSGVCLEFDKDTFLEFATNVPNLRYGPVKYKTIKDLRAVPAHQAELPFLKRFAFIDEKEFRLFLGTQTKSSDMYQFNISLDIIQRITLSPWLPREVAKNIKKLLQTIDGCKLLKIFRSTLIENEDWKKLAGN